MLKPRKIPISPLPWVVQDLEDGQISDIRDAKGDYVICGIYNEDAEYIFNALKSHSAFTAALEALEAAKKYHDADHGCNGFTAEYESLRLEIDTALDKARGAA